VKTRKKIVYVKEPPEGLFYLPGFLSPAQEHGLLKHVSEQPFEPYDHHGYKANREVVYFGTQGGYNGLGAEEKAEAMPEWLTPLRERFADVIGLSPEELVMALVARYEVGAGIGWHRDRPQFGPSVLGLSLASDAEMRFRRFVGDNEEMYKIKLERGSAYVIGGPARSVWQHGMNPVKELRYSITFRTLRDKLKDATDARHDPETIAKRLRGLRFSEPTGQLKLHLS
jgi:alkylated DNA repair protein (DNA oxidative demethylase)